MGGGGKKFFSKALDVITGPAMKLISKDKGGSSPAPVTQPKVDDSQAKVTEAAGGLTDITRQRARKTRSVFGGTALGESASLARKTLLGQ